MRYSPQRFSNIALIVSALVLLFAAVLATRWWAPALRQIRKAKQASRVKKANKKDPTDGEEGRPASDGNETPSDAGPDGTVAAGTVTVELATDELATDEPAPDGADAAAVSTDSARTSVTTRAFSPAGPWPRPMPRIAVEIGLVLAGAFFLGYAGLVAALLVVALLRWAPVPAQWLIGAGAGLIGASVLLYVIVLWAKGLVGQVSADAVSASLWPHYLGAAGLLISLVGALRDHVPMSQAQTSSDPLPEQQLEQTVDSHR